ncbi:MAG TPA: class I SAM-dependent methyltransferase [Nitrospiraceae bacterium]|jgi:cyclopropane fatty-acyl-phospholipid synthase-like methyltransferase|nr:class I SAM-dependent methyltransferase [Nitrospiraceae bacterium]
MIKTFEDFRDTVSAYRLPGVIISALELDLFTAIGRKSRPVADLAKTMRVSERGLDILCRNLAMCGLLTKRGARYRNSRLAATELNRTHSAYRGAYIELLRNHWGDWLRLTDSVRTGLPVDPETMENTEYRRQFTWAMHYRSRDVAPEVARKISLRGARTLLDLGGGPGTYALAFLKRNAQLQATVCDRPAALDVARQVAASEGAGARLSYLPLDFMTDPLQGHYDVIWYSNVLHIYSAAENQALFTRILPALNPGGRLIIQDAFLQDKEGIYPTDASLFAVTMLLFTPAGNTYSLRDTTKWLRQAGYVSVKPIKMKKGMEDWEDGLLQAVRPSSR